MSLIHVILFSLKFNLKHFSLQEQLSETRYIGLLVKYMLFLLDLKETEFSQQIFEKY